jgi:hypothetical protein
MNLPKELLYEIINLVIESDVDSCQDILKWKSEIATTVELISVNRLIYNYIIQSAGYHRLRLWKLLSYIPRQYEPIQLAVGTSDTQFALLQIEVRNERIDARNYENFLVLEEESTNKKWTKMNYLYVVRPTAKSSSKAMLLPFFELDSFFQDLNYFTNQNCMSIWLWKKSNSFFKRERINNDDFKPILDTQSKSLMAWDRKTTKNKRGLTESVMLYNTELFGRLL